MRSYDYIVSRIASIILADYDYIYDPNHELHLSDLPSGKKYHKTDRGWSTTQSEPEISQYRLNQKVMKLKPEDMDNEMLARVLKKAKSKGYDIRGKKDLQDILFRGLLMSDGTRKAPMVKNHMLVNSDWVDIIQEAMGGKNKRIENLQKKKEVQNKHPHVDRQRLRELGYTNDIREGGYITSDGRMVNLSGGHGGIGSRGLDHREIGGSKGMREFMAEGNIRMDGHSGSFDIASEPTEEQYVLMSRIIRNHYDVITIDLEHELGEEGQSYYYPSKDKESLQYPPHTSVNKIFSDIRNYFRKHK
jgi:hypothetical protein